MIALARAYLVFETSHLSLQVSNDLLQDLKVALACLVILDLLTISVNDAVSGIISRGNDGCTFESAVICQTHSSEFTVYLLG